MRADIQATYSEIWKKHGAFFAFSDSQYKEKAIEGVEYVNVFAGLLAPKNSYKQMLDEMEEALNAAKLTNKKPTSKIKLALKELEKANKKVVKRHRYACGLIDAPDIKEESATLFFESPDGQNGELYNELRALKWENGGIAAEYNWSVRKNGVKITYTEGDIYISLV